VALRDASELLWPAVAETLATLDLGPEHAAAKKLAQRYAQVIDEAKDQGWAMRWIGPLLLDSLTALGATPTAKAALSRGVTSGNAPEDPLEALRRSRRRGA
jgi:hypothetical protein